MGRTVDSPKPPPSNRPQRPVRVSGALNRRRALEEELLKVKLASMGERIELVQTLASGGGLSLAERRQVLIAIQRYLFSQPSELPEDLSGLLEAVLHLADKPDLRLKALDLFRQSLEFLGRGQVAGQLKGPLERLLNQYLPRGATLEFTPELFLKVGRRLEHNGEREGLVHLATLGLFFFPFSGPLREVRADCQLLLGQLGAARGDYDRLIEQFPDRLEYRLDRAEASMKLEDHEEALGDLDYCLRYDPDSILALRRRADCLSQLGRNLEALRTLDRVIGLDEKNPDQHVSRARVNEQLEFFDEAIKDTERALELEERHAEARQLRHSLMLRRQSFGMEDDLYTAFLRGDEELFLGGVKIPETRFADVAGLDVVKERIREAVEYPLKYAEISERYGKKAGGGLLFFGPPGCGKTLLARAAAGECGVTFINVNLSTVLDKWVGNSEKAVSMIFSSARKRRPSIIFLDEVDAIGASRINLQAGWEKKLISQLLIELDGLASMNEDVIVLGASNAPWEVDFALRRPGRLGQLVFVPPPDIRERAAIFKLYLDRKPYVGDDLDLTAMAEMTELYSADAIRQIVENAATIPWRAAIETGEARAIGQVDLMTAAKQMPPDLAEWEKLVSRYQEFAKQSLRHPGIGFRKGTPQHE